MSNSVPKLNPLNIDFGQIIAAGQRRSDILGQINDLVHTKVDAALTGAVDAENFFNEMNRLWDALDPEGRTLLPDEVTGTMRVSNVYQGYLKTLIGSKSSSNLGLISIAGYGVGAVAAEESQFLDMESFKGVTALKTPDGVLRPSDYVTPTFQITYDPSWSCEDFPNGAWVAHREDWDRSEAIPGTDPNDAYAKWELRNQP